MTLPKSAILILGMVIPVTGTPADAELRCNETHCAVSKEDLRVLVQYIRQLEKECSAKTI